MSIDSTYVEAWDNLPSDLIIDNINHSAWLRQIINWVFQSNDELDLVVDQYFQQFPEYKAQLLRESERLLEIASQKICGGLFSPEPWFTQNVWLIRWFRDLWNQVMNDGESTQIERQMSWSDYSWMSWRERISKTLGT